MAHSYVSNLMRYIFSTKERFPFIDQELESRLWPYMGGIARENGMKALANRRNSRSRSHSAIAAGDAECGESDSTN
jgi:hypothetical protein